MSFKHLLCVVLLTFGTVHIVMSQQNIEEQIQQLKNELSIVRAQLDSLRAGQPESSYGESEVDNLEEQLEKRFQELENKIDAVARSTTSTILNPKTTAFINFAGRFDNAAIYDYTGSARIDNRFYLRSVELDFRAPVDPYAEAIAILSVEDEAGTGYALDPEEVYGLIKRLPLLEEAPLGLKLKIGKFRAPFGVSNKIHMHDLPWTTRPLAVSSYLGTEHGDFFESGYNPVGLDVDLFVPVNPFGMTTEMNLSMVRGGELGLPNVDEQTPGTGGYLAWVGHLGFSKDWENEHLFNLGFSVCLDPNKKPDIITPADINSGEINYPVLGGIDFTYKWAPAEQRESNSLVVSGELFRAAQSLRDSQQLVVRNTPLGWYLYAQYQTSYSVYLGARFDWLEEPVLEKPITRALSFYASYYTTEFLRFRVGFEQRWSELPQINYDSNSTFLLDVNFVFGSHPVEPYWVNR